MITTRKYSVAWWHTIMHYRGLLTPEAADCIEERIRSEYRSCTTNVMEQALVVALRNAAPIQ